MRSPYEDADEESPGPPVPDHSEGNEPTEAPARSPLPPRSRRQRLMVATGVSALAVLAVGLVWIVVTGLLARSQLTHVRDELPRLRQALVSGDLDKARSLAADIQQSARRAHELTTGPAWWVASSLPLLGSPLDTSRVIAAQGDRLSVHVLPQVLALAQEVDGLHLGKASVDLAELQRLEPSVDDAARVAHDVNAKTAATSSSWLPAVSSARESLLNQLQTVDSELTGAQRALSIAIPMLGANGPQRYFVGFMNEAESRGLGGIPGAFAIATADRGHLTFDHFGSDTEMKDVRADVDLGADYQALYGQDDPTGTFPNSDISPDFRDAAQIWAGMWQAKTGQRIDGAIAIDPTALSYLLAVTGPAQLADGSEVSSGNVVALTQRDLYRRFGGGSKADDAARKRYVVGLSRAVSRKLADGGSPHRLVQAVSRAATERRFVVWSADAPAERDLRTAGWAGAVEAPAGTPYAGLVVNNAAGNKLDYYLDRSLTYRRASCTTGNATATIRLTNAAPAGLPPYVTIRADTRDHATRAGDNRLLVAYYASPGARIRSVTVDGRPQQSATLVQNGLTVVTLDVELPRATTTTIRIRLVEPADTAAAPSVLRQPLVRPLVVTVDAPACD